MANIVSIGLGGFLGAIGRYYISGVFYRWWGTGLPYGTFAVNIIGCFFLGFVMTLTEERFLVNPVIRSFLAIGFLGAFTTFSTFSFETLMLIRDGSFFAAVENILLSMVIGLVAIYLGIVLARWI